MVNEELMASGEFEVMSLEADEDEHSIEMHLSYVARVMQGHRDFTVVPVLVGSLSPEKESAYGRIFAKYLNDPSCLFVVSSDFCHWGQRFRYTYYDDKKGEIHESIKALDYMVSTVGIKIPNRGRFCRQPSPISNVSRMLRILDLVSLARLTIVSSKV